MSWKKEKDNPMRGKKKCPVCKQQVDVTVNSRLQQHSSSPGGGRCRGSERRV